MYEIYETIRDFVERGGDVMVVLAWVVFIMWTLIVERLIFMLTENRIGLKAVLAERESRLDQKSWSARAIYDTGVSQLSMRFESGIPMIRTLARLCPLFGLMGTVTGMILIFDVMAATGGGSPRAMAAGVAKATLTTMAGMVGALSGIFPAAILSRLAQNQQASLQMHCLTSTGIALSPISVLAKPLRWIVAPTAALVITLGLLFLMQTLIETGEAVIQEGMVSDYVEFIRVRRDERIETRNLKPKKIMPEESPEMLNLRPASEQEAGTIAIDYSVAGPAIDTMDLAGLFGDFGPSDAEFFPLVRILPIYPRRALARRIEGWVIVEFTITKAGTVRNVRVLESSDPMFESSAVRAVEKFKYRARVINSQPVVVTGVRHKLTYILDN